MADGDGGAGGAAAGIGSPPSSSSAEPPPPEQQQEQEEEPGPTLFLKGMPRIVDRGAFLALIRAHLPPEAAARFRDTDAVLNAGRGTAIILVPDRAAAQRLVDAGAAGRLTMGHRTVKVDWGKQPFRPYDTTSAEHREREVRRCVNDLCRHAATNFAAHRRELRRQRWRAQRRLLAELDAAAEAEGRIARNFCWDFAASGGKRCPRGAGCPFPHIADVSIAALPPSVRLAVAKGDAFQAHHAASPHKARVNAALARLAAGVRNPRCLVLDDAHLHTVRALLADPGGQRRGADDIVVPNVVTDTFLRIQASGLCHAVPGSVRAYLDSIDVDVDVATAAADGEKEGEESKRFGLIYLDYCGRLSAGKGNVELSPVEDLKVLFAKRLCDPHGCVLAVCLRKEKKEEEETEEEAEAEEEWDDGSRALRELVCGLARRHGRGGTAPLEEEGHAYGEHFVSVFRVAAAAKEAEEEEEGEEGEGALNK